MLGVQLLGRGSPHCDWSRGRGCCRCHPCFGSSMKLQMGSSLRWCWYRTGLLSFVYQHPRNEAGDGASRWAVASARASIVFILVQLLMKSALLGGMAVALGVGMATLLLRNRSRVPPNAM